MIEIIPNWHPLLVHFTVGLLSTSVLFYLASAVLSRTNSWKQQWLNMANWSLWSGCLFAIATAIAGWLAYNSVAHDSASHAAMTLHRNWALPTASIFLLLGLWAIFIARKDRRPGFLFLTFSIIAAGLLMVTGWLGAEAVYRYGLGVQSLPVVTEGADGHNHSHGSEHDEPTMDEGEHQHGHGHESQMLLPEQPLNEATHSHNHQPEETLSETEQLNGHQHKHESQILSPQQPLNKAAHQHSHLKKESLSRTEQQLEQSEHQHEHIKETTFNPELINEVTKQTDKMMPDNITEPSALPLPIEQHTHDHEH